MITLDDGSKIHECHYCIYEPDEPCISIPRHSQSSDVKHKQGIIKVCMFCLHDLYMYGDVVKTGNYDPMYQFKEDALSKYKF